MTTNLKFLSVEEYRKEYEEGARKFGECFDEKDFPLYDSDLERRLESESEWWEYKTERYNDFVQKTLEAIPDGIDERF